MVESEQSREIGREWFSRLQDEIATVPAGDLEVFLTARDPDSMGFFGKEGVDDAD